MFNIQTASFFGKIGTEKKIPDDSRRKDKNDERDNEKHDERVYPAEEKLLGNRRC